MLFPEDTGPRQKTPSFVKNTSYLNPRLKMKGKLQRKELKDNVVPSQWPMCPTLLSNIVLFRNHDYKNGVQQIRQVNQEAISN